MRVTEAMTFDLYWTDPRFASKRPSLHGSLKQAFGDNIYHRHADGWSQENSHHSMPDGSANKTNVAHDTRPNRVLISDHFAYWGGQGPAIPAKFRDWDGLDISLGRQGHRCRFPSGLVKLVVEWLEQEGTRGYIGKPGDW
jgi:Nucleotide modification associated domain 2